MLLSDADSIFLSDPWPWLGREGVPPAPEAAKGGLVAADLIVTNDIAAAEGDGVPSTVMNSGARLPLRYHTPSLTSYYRCSSACAPGALFLRAAPRTRRFVQEWAARTIRTSDAGNDQTELNRLLTNRYKDGDWACNDPRCVLPRPY